MTIKIFNVPFKIEEVDVIDEAGEGITQGLIVYSESKIYIKKSLPKELKKSVLFHEVLHGMLEMLGYPKLSEDETFVQGMSMLMYQMFDFKKGVKEKEK